MEHIRYRQLPTVVEDKMELQSVKFVPNVQANEPVSKLLLENRFHNVRKLIKNVF